MIMSYAILKVVDTSSTLSGHFPHLTHNLRTYGRLLDSISVPVCQPLRTLQDSAAPPPWRAILEVLWRYRGAGGCQSPGNNHLLRCALCLRAVSQPVRQIRLNPKVYKRAGPPAGHNGWWLGRSHLLRNLA